MRKEIREVDHERGILQTTLCDERWYSRLISVDGTATNKRWQFVPSTSWVASYFPKDVRFFKYLASKGWSEAEEYKSMRGTQGSKVHQAIKSLIEGHEVKMSDSFTNPDTLKDEELDNEEWLCIMSFVDWFKSEQPEIEIIRSEYVVWNDKYNYAGTVDLKCRLGKRKLRNWEGKSVTRRAGLWIIDFKISPEIWPSYEIQLSGYKHADSNTEPVNLAILQLGYKKNKHKKWKFTPIKDQFNLFLAVRKIWARETAGIQPLQRDYPLSLSLGIAKAANG
ncbi:MAG TPA: hypothetical protein VFO86_09460 [Terriglobia bacterium]|nr:hypothetical protein [Terriglobia bacterium]